MFYAFNDFRPVVDPSAYVHPQASVIGDVVIGKDVYIGPGCVLRGDWGRIDIHDGCNVQENCTIHMFPGVTVVLEKNAHIGHGAVIHGAHIGENSLVGMNAVVMDDVVIGKECIVGALAFVAQGTHIPDRKIVVGNPAKIVKDVTDEVAEWKGEGTRLYQTLPNQWRSNTAECEPLRALESNRPEHPQTYFPKQKR
jgi:phenylacetic acid degradation protein/carnitine operon protein CaiE